MPSVQHNGATNHPAELLSNLIDEDAKSQLLKTPPVLYIEESRYQDRLSEIRSNPNYTYLVQWLYLLKHVIKFQDAFDVSNFEEELLGIATPVFLNNFKTKLIQFLTNYKMEFIDVEFTEQINLIFGTTTSNEDQLDGKVNENYIDFNKLDLNEQLNIIYDLVQFANRKSADNFRKNVDKYTKPQEDLRLEAVYEVNHKNIREEWLLPEDSRLYYKKSKYPSMVIPNSRKDTLDQIKDPLESFPEIEPKLMEYKCLAVGIYQFDSFLKDLKQKAGNKKSSNDYRLYSKLVTEYDRVLQHDMKKRKQALARKREIQMQALMVHRKRSSRLEAKERQRQEEEERARLEQERMKAEAAEIRAAKRIRMKEQMFENATASSRSQSPSVHGSREERLRKRQKTHPSSSYKKDDESWKFDCLCGIKQLNFDDGSKLIGCESCDRWQHVKCQPERIQQLIEDESNTDYKFQCSFCRVSHQITDSNADNQHSEQSIIQPTDPTDNLHSEQSITQPTDPVDTATLVAIAKTTEVFQPEITEASEGPVNDATSEPVTVTTTTTTTTTDTATPGSEIEIASTSELNVARVENV